MNRIPVELSTWATADLQPRNPLDLPAIDRLSTIHTPALLMAEHFDDPEVLRAVDVMTDTIKGAKKHIFRRARMYQIWKSPKHLRR